MLANRKRVLSELKPYTKCCLERYPLRAVLCGATNWKLADDGGLLGPIKHFLYGFRQLKRNIVIKNDTPITSTMVLQYSVLADLFREIYKFIKNKNIQFKVDKSYINKNLNMSDIEAALKARLSKFDCYKGLDLVYFYIVCIWDFSTIRTKSMFNGTLHFPATLITNTHARVEYSEAVSYFMFYDIVVNGSDKFRQIKKANENNPKGTIVYHSEKKMIPYDPHTYAMLPLQTTELFKTYPDRTYRQYKREHSRFVSLAIFQVKNKK